MTRRNFFLLITSHHDVRIYIFFKQKYWSQIFNYGPPRQARQAKKRVAIKNSLGLLTRGGLAASAETG